MGLFDQLQQLEQLHDCGQLSRAELERAKLDLLENAPADDPDAGTLTLEEALGLDQNQQQSEVDRIDREWHQERRRYEFTPQSGRTFVPTMWGSWAQMVACLAFGIWWTVTGFSYPPGRTHGSTIFPWLGVAIIVFSAAQGLYFLIKAEQYQTAEAAYQRRRQEATNHGSE